MVCKTRIISTHSRNPSYTAKKEPTDTVKEEKAPSPERKKALRLVDENKKREIDTFVDQKSNDGNW